MSCPFGGPSWCTCRTCANRPGELKFEPLRGFLIYGGSSLPHPVRYHDGYDARPRGFVDLVPRLPPSRIRLEALQAERDSRHKNRRRQLTVTSERMRRFQPNLLLKMAILLRARCQLFAAMMMMVQRRLLPKRLVEIVLKFVG